jgi:hypothetical protein
MSARCARRDYSLDSTLRVGLTARNGAARRRVNAIGIAAAKVQTGHCEAGLAVASACAIVKDMQRKGWQGRAVPLAALGTLLVLAAHFTFSAVQPKPASAGAPNLTSRSAGATRPTAQQRGKTTKRPNAKEKKETPTGAPLCESKNITVELPREFLPLVVLNNSFIAKNSSVGVITLQNYFPQAIEEIAIVAEYKDATGVLIYPGVFAASATQVTTPSWFATYLPTQYEIATWAKPIAPRATFTLGTTSGITTAACPAQIDVTLLHIRFNNGQEMNYSAPGWQLPAQPEQIPGDMELFLPASDLPQEFLVKVHVPAPLGPIIPPPDVQLVDGTQGIIFDRIRDQIQEWRFWFAMRNGASVDGDEMLLIRLHSPKEKVGPQTFWVARDDVPEPLGVIDLVPQRVPGQWAVYYGGVNLSANDVPQMQ